MSIPIENEFFREPGENHTWVTKHLRIRDDQVLISTEHAFFTKGLKLVYDKDFPEHGTTTVRFLTDDSITSVWSDQVEFHWNEDKTEWTAVISDKHIQGALSSDTNRHIDFYVSGRGGRRFDPQIRVTPF